MDKELATFSFKGKTLYIMSTTYKEGNRTAIVIQDNDGCPQAVLTVNLPNQPLEDDEFFVKTWSENEEISRAALYSGLFLDTGKRVTNGFVQAHVWKFAPVLLLRFLRKPL